MTGPVIITCALLAAWGISLTWLAMRHDVPGFGFLDRLPDPAALLGGALDKLTVPLRYRRATGQHAAPPALRRGRDGLLHNAEDQTGPLPILDDSMFTEATP